MKTILLYRYFVIDSLTLRNSYQTIFLYLSNFLRSVLRVMPRRRAASLLLPRTVIQRLQNGSFFHFFQRKIFRQTMLSQFCRQLELSAIISASSSASRYSARDRTTALSTAFISSRTLPGQAYFKSFSIACGVKPLMFLEFFAAKIAGNAAPAKEYLLFFPAAAAHVKPQH